jgi:mannose-1-phosphate guanylyltransferase/mannose-1-phosphate guanylyltransferase/mannose-6-phosphate isomerase
MMTNTRGRIVPVLLSGGTGSRLWPLSRETYPKQLLSLLGERTLLQQTALRVADPQLFADPMVIANAEHRFAIGEQLRAVGVSDPTIVLEPVGRNTAPAVAIAALLANEADPDAVILVMPVDHWVRDHAAFRSAVSAGLTAARQGGSFYSVCARPRRRPDLATFAWERRHGSARCSRRRRLR